MSIDVVGMVEFEDEHEEGVETPAGHALAEVECRGCGRGQVIVPVLHEALPWCGECRPAVARFPERDRDLYPAMCGPAGFLPSELRAPTYEIPKSAGRPAAFDPASFPAPEVTSRDPWDGGGCPDAVGKLAQRAVGAGWGARVQRSRGSAPHAATGRPGAVKTRYALVLSSERWSAYAVHDGSGWVSIMLWGAGRAWFPYASLTDLSEYVDARGEMNDDWYAAIVERERDRGRRAKARAACNRGTHVDAVTENGMVFCPDCENAWKAGGAAWRKPKKEREGMS